MMGGHAAERLVYDETTTGAESDLEQATALARQMVGRWGMSETVGLVTALPQGVGDWPPQVAPHTLELIDEEVRRMTEESHRCALHALAEHRGQLDALAAALLEHETLDEAEAHRAAGIPPSAGADDPAPAAANVLARA